jgi:hypothetical protein
MIGLDADGGTMESSSTSPIGEPVPMDQPPLPTTDASTMAMTQPVVPIIQDMDAFSELLNPVATSIDAPSQQLMGMLDSTGAEVLEYPAGSGVMWTRPSPSEAWHQR